jgi:paraquat-inducible protein A
MKTEMTARAQGLVRCHDCGLVAEIAANANHCNRCGGHLHSRKPDSLKRTTACLITGYILYIPANLLPMMTVNSFGSGSPDTIASGIIELIHSGMIPIAILVLVASILVPLLKLVGLTLLLLCVHNRWQQNTRTWTVIYRIISLVGRWSMLDIFMISILVALVDLGGIAQIIAGPAAIAFGSVVVITIFAANNFDPRLLWDNK